MQNETAMGLLLITHDLGVVADAADRVAVMYARRVVEAAPVRQIFSNRRIRTRWAYCTPCRAVIARAIS